MPVVDIVGDDVFFGPELGVTTGVVGKHADRVAVAFDEWVVTEAGLPEAQDETAAAEVDVPPQLLRRLALADEAAVSGQPVYPPIVAELVPVADHVHDLAVRPPHAHLPKVHPLDAVDQLVDKGDRWPVQPGGEVPTPDRHEYVVDESRTSRTTAAGIGAVLGDVDRLDVQPGLQLDDHGPVRDSGLLGIGRQYRTRVRASRRLVSQTSGRLPRLGRGGWRS